MPSLRPGTFVRDATKPDRVGRENLASLTGLRGDRLVALPPEQRASITRLILTLESNRDDQ